MRVCGSGPVIVSNAARFPLLRGSTSITMNGSGTGAPIMAYGHLVHQVFDLVGVAAGGEAPASTARTASSLCSTSDKTTRVFPASHAHGAHNTALRMADYGQLLSINRVESVKHQPRQDTGKVSGLAKPAQYRSRP